MHVFIIALYYDKQLTAKSVKILCFLCVNLYYAQASFAQHHHHHHHHQSKMQRTEQFSYIEIFILGNKNTRQSERKCIHHHHQYATTVCNGYHLSIIHLPTLICFSFFLSLLLFCSLDFVVRRWLCPAHWHDHFYHCPILFIFSALDQ